MYYKTPRGMKEFHCTLSMTIPHFRSESFLGRWEMVQGWPSLHTQRSSDSGVPGGTCVNCKASCMGRKATLGVTVHLTIKFH